MLLLFTQVKTDSGSSEAFGQHHPDIQPYENNSRIEDTL